MRTAARSLASILEMFDGMESGPKTFNIRRVRGPAPGLEDLRSGRYARVIDIPPDYSRRVQQRNRPQIALIEDNTDNFITTELLQRVNQLIASVNAPSVTPRLASQVDLQVVEVYPYIDYIKYLLSGSYHLSIFVVAMVGGGIIFIDDKARGLHEGYLVTPVHKSELVLGLVLAGALKGVMAGMTITIIGGLIAGIERLWDPIRLLYLLLVISAASLAMISLMFLVMVRVEQSDGASRRFRRAERAAVFSLGRRLSGRGVSGLAARDFQRRSIHVYRARPPQPDPKNDWH